jgi:ketosteroid isomerase-like protein
MVTEEVLILASGRPPVHGRGDLRAELSGLVDRYRLELSGKARQIQIADGVAYCWAEISLLARPRDGGPAVLQSGPTLLIFERQPDGGWLLARQANLVQFAA